MSRTSEDGRPADPGLTEHGHAQARAVSRWLARESIDRIVSSPSRRARETAAPLANEIGLQPEVDERLAEIDPTASRYLSIEEERARDHDRFRARIRAYQADPRIEALSRRVEEALTEWAGKSPGGRVVVFCHGGVVNVWTRCVLGMSPGVLFEAQNASSHRFLVSRSGVKGVRSLNGQAGPSSLARMPHGLGMGN